MPARRTVIADVVSRVRIAEPLRSSNGTIGTSAVTL